MWIITLLILFIRNGYYYEQPACREVERTNKSVVQVAYETIPTNEVEAYVLQEMGNSGILLCRCESGCRANAVSSTGRYKGVFQYSDSTWNSNCTGDIFDYKAQTDCTKRLIEEGQIGKWPHCGRYF